MLSKRPIDPRRMVVYSHTYQAVHSIAGYSHCGKYIGDQVVGKQAAGRQGRTAQRRAKRTQTQKYCICCTDDQIICSTLQGSQDIRSDTVGQSHERAKEVACAGLAVSIQRETTPVTATRCPVQLPSTWHAPSPARHCKCVHRPWQERVLRGEACGAAEEKPNQHCQDCREGQN